MENPDIHLKIEPPLPIRERVYDHLKQEIMNGRMPSGSVLVESRVAEQIGVSRTPVREALHFLEKEGLLELLPRVGYRVREIERKEFEEICEIRKVNEDLAVRWAVERITSEGLSALERNLAVAEERLREEAWEAFVDLDAEFHELLAEASGSRRLQALIKSLRADMLRYRIQSLHQAFTAALALQGHKKIFQCIQEGNVSSASAEVLAHLEESKKYILVHSFEEKNRD
jgi:DNA-binding GntR family transcriptional regulator